MELRTLSKYSKKWSKCPKCLQYTYLDEISRCARCGYPTYSFSKKPGDEAPVGYWEAMAKGEWGKAKEIGEGDNPQLSLFDNNKLKGLSKAAEEKEIKEFEFDIEEIRRLAILNSIRNLSIEAAHWNEVELQKVKEYYLQEREKGRKDDNNIYNEIAEKLNRTPSSIKQKVEFLKNTNDKFKPHKFKHWTRESIIKALEDVYKTNKENFHRTALPEDLRSQIKHHIGDWFDSFDGAMAEAIYNTETTNGHTMTLDEARNAYRNQHKLAHRWNKEEIIGLFKAAHEAGLPITINFFAKQPEVYKPLLGVNRSLEGLKDSVKNHFVSWGAAVIEAGLVDNKYYDEEGRPLGSTEEIRLAKFFDLNNIKYRRCTATDKIAVTDPEILEQGYKNFVGDFYVLNNEDKEVALVEVFGSIINSGKKNLERNKTVGELYREKREAKLKYYSTLKMPFIYIDNDEDKGLSDESLKEKFATFLIKNLCQPKE